MERTLLSTPSQSQTLGGSATPLLSTDNSSNSHHSQIEAITPMKSPKIVKLPPLGHVTLDIPKRRRMMPSSPLNSPTTPVLQHTPLIPVKNRNFSSPIVQGRRTPSLVETPIPALTPPSISGNYATLSSSPPADDDVWGFSSPRRSKSYMVHRERDRDRDTGLSRRSSSPVRRRTRYEMGMGSFSTKRLSLSPLKQYAKPNLSIPEQDENLEIIENQNYAYNNSEDWKDMADFKNDIESLKYSVVHIKYYSGISDSDVKKWRIKSRREAEKLLRKLRVELELMGRDITDIDMRNVLKNLKIRYDDLYPRES